MPTASRRPNTTLLAILGLWVLFYASFTLRAPALLDDADSVHAEVAREMLARHDFVTLYANGIRYLEKAPLLYWVMAAAMRVSQALGHGSPEALAVAARVPLALTVLALALLVEAFARRAYGAGRALPHGERAGLYAGLILLSSPGIFLFTRILLPDAMLCLWLAVSMYAFWRIEGEEAPPPHLCWLFAGACALGILTKGMIGVVFPVGITALYLVLTRGVGGAIRRVRGLHPVSSAMVFLALAAPWHVSIGLANPAQGSRGSLGFALHSSHGEPHWNVPLPTEGNVHGWTWFYFVNEQVLRYLNLRVPRDYDTVPLWLFWGLCLVWLMPWSAFLFQAVTHAVQQVWRRSRQGLPLLLLVWTAVPVVFFSASTRQEYYVLPALPAAILLLAGWMAEADRGDAGDRMGNWSPGRESVPTTTAGKQHEAFELHTVGTGIARATGVLVALSLAASAVCLYLLLHARAPASGSDLAALLNQNPGEYALSMGHVMDLNAEALGLFRIPLVLAALSLPAGPLASYWLRAVGRPRAAVLALAAGGFGFLLAAHLGLQRFAPVLSSADLARAIAPAISQTDGNPAPLVVIHQEYEFGATLAFYLQRPGYRRMDGRVVAVDPIHILTEPEYRGTPMYGRSSNLWYGSFFSDAPRVFESRESLAAEWAGPKRVFLWQDLGAQPSGTPALPTPVYVITKEGGKEILSNQPNR
ncbi:MAG: phospholipid carrier-dependent glycosyltransferase [Acidobacteriota bacterium]|nr:phospholipid carrier-dependent glycosyltransferase [Acidobacteriota bacterium]